MRVCILGNSVGFKIRPPRRGAQQRTYAEVLRDYGHEVHNASMGGALLSEQFALLDDDVITRAPDVVILHHGVIEVFYRRTFRAPNNAAILNQYRNRVLRQGYTDPGPVGRLAHFALRAFNAVTRATARALGLRWQWQRPTAFLRVVRATIELILKETPARVLIVGVTPPSKSAETDLPGLTQAIARLNQALKSLANDFGPRARFVDVVTLVAGHEYEDLVPDGIHFSALGHRLLAESLQSCMTEDVKDPCRS
jgi:hypothetical protein